MGWNSTANLFPEGRSVLCRSHYGGQSTYAREITEPQFAYGMEGLLHSVTVKGVFPAY